MTKSIITAAAELPPGLARAAFTLACAVPLAGPEWCWKKEWERRLSCSPHLRCSQTQVWFSELQIWLLIKLLNLLRKANTPSPSSLPIAPLKGVPVGHAAKAIYSWNKVGPGVVLPYLTPFETAGKAAAAWVPVCTLLCVNTHANWASAGKGRVWLNGTQSKCQINRFSLS